MERKLKHKELIIMLCYCKKCGRIVQESRNKTIQTCDYCGNKLGYVPDKYLGGKSKGFIIKDLKQQFIDEYIKSSPEFDQYLFEHRDEDMFNKRMSDKAKMAHGKAVLEEQSRVAKCPSCGSANVSKIGVVNRTVSTGLFGLASSKIGKTHKCNNCGTTW